MKIALVLGGGAARGLAHIGVLKVLEREKFPIHLIIGTSTGALIGGLYALNPKADEVENRLLEYIESDPFKKLRMDFFHQESEKKIKRRRRFLSPIPGLLERGIFVGRSLTRLSFISPEIIQENSYYLFGESRFQESRIPMYITATDLDSGTERILSRGLMRDAVAASCAIPSILPPVYIEGRPLVDGGCISLVPISAARRLGAHMVMACNVGSNQLNLHYHLRNSFDVAARAYEITLFFLRRRQIREADVLISPKVSNINWADFSKAREYIQRGEQAAKQALKGLWKKRLLKRLQRFLFFSS